MNTDPLRPAPPDLSSEEAPIHACLAVLDRPPAPAALRAHVLALGGSGSGRRWSVGLWALAATVLVGVGVLHFGRAASRVLGHGNPPHLAVVEDPDVPLFKGLEPAGSLGPDDEVVLYAGR
jgi:hypothetical protein